MRIYISAIKTGIVSRSACNNLSMHRNGIIFFTTFVLLAGLSVFTCLISGCLAGVHSADEETVMTGTVTRLSPDNSAYGIFGDDGILYYPVNPDPSFVNNNTRVRFTFVTQEEKVPAVLSGKPIYITSIQAFKSPSLTDDHHPVTLEESRLPAEHYVTSMKEYTGYGATNLTLAEVVTLRCPSCWQFVYTFDMQSLKDPAFTDRAVVGVTIESGKITDVVASYGIRNGSP
jgi:hypothetical protein